jgi:hypothetical protein
MRWTGITARAATRFALAAGLALAAGGTLAVAGLAGTAGGDGDPAAAAFRVADGSAACNYADGKLSCRADGMPAAVVLEPDGRAHAGDPSTVGWDDSTPVLLRSESWWHGGFSCRLSAAAIACRSAAGAVLVKIARAGTR